MTIEIIRIFKESFRNVREHKLEWLRVAYAPLVVWLFGVAFLAIVNLSLGLWSYESLTNSMKVQEAFADQPFIVILANIIYYITYFIAYIAIIINGFRYAVLREGGNRWWTLNLDWRFVKTVLYSLLIGLLVGIYGLITAGITIGAYYLVESTPLTAILGILFALYGFYLLVRIGLTYLLIAIDQNNPIRVSWRLLKGSVLRLAGLILLIIIVLLGIFLVGIIALSILGWALALITPVLLVIPGVLFLVFGFCMWLLTWAVTSKAYALVYKTFTEGVAF